MSGKAAVWSVIAAAVLIGLAWIAVARRAAPSGDQPSAAKSPFLPELREMLRKDPQIIDGIEIGRAGEKAVLVRVADGWIAPDKAGYPLDESRVEEILKALLTLERVEALTADPARHGELGLAWPDESGQATLVRLFSKGAVVAEVVTGRTKFTPPAVYVRKADENQTWRCAGEFSSQTDAARLMNTVLADLPPGVILAIEWGPARLERDDAGSWQVEGDVPEAKRSDVVRILPELFTRLEFDDVRATPAEPVTAADSVRAILPDRTLTLELLPLEAGEVPGSPAATPQRWVRLVVGDQEPGLAAQALSEEDLKRLDAIRTRSAGREFRLPSWRSGRLATLMSPEA